MVPNSVVGRCQTIWQFTAQGNSNVTHGCVNLSLTDAQEYFHSAIWGDPVEVTGTSMTLGPDDGDICIWALSWDQWKAKSVG